MSGFGKKMQRAVTRLLPASMQARINVFAVFAVACPALAVIALCFAMQASVAATLIIASLALVPATLLLYGAVQAAAPIRGVAAALADCAGDPSGAPGADHFHRLQSNLRAVVAKIETMERHGTRDPVSGLAVREEFLHGVTGDLSRGRGESLMGIVRFANYERVAAFDAAAGKSVLAAFAARLRDAVHPARRVGHVDRDSFAIWFSGVDRKRAVAELRALAYVLAQEIIHPDLTLAPDVQIGFAIYPIDADDGASLLSRAFVSLARPQRTAEGRIAFFAPPSAQDARRSFALEQDLRQAVRRGELALAYQPCVDVTTGEVCGAEALLRWRHRELGEVPPGEFVGLLEKSGLVHEIGLWTLNTACRQLSAWRNTPLANVKIAINLSAHQLRDQSLKAALQRTLTSHCLDPQQLELELTETVAMEDAERTLQLFQELKQLGFSLAIDDFGSGYSSLGYLKRLPFNKLKIDREFVTRVDERADSRAICRALIELSAGLGISVLAEGVERLDEVEALHRLGCSTFQGYFFAPPLAPDAFEERVLDGEWLRLVGSHVHREQAEIRRRFL
ncbi:EAL domain-containing protein [Terricaulis sp.]|uniref:bifunctional diguanylate cyclase/phosphodiesterase n=1 Tax=Terricaulis sp. TaxID=2768686 RepID=UPI003783F4CA